MKKMEFMKYTSMKIAEYCGDLYRTGKITNFSVKCEYSRVSIRTKTRHGVADGTLEFVFYSSGKIVVKGYSDNFDDFKFETLYYEWAENTATEDIAKRLRTDLKSAVSVVIFRDIANCFNSEKSAERMDI